MSTESALKQSAVTEAMARAGARVAVEGKKVPSGVAEQPMTIEETYEGAMNRHKNLKDLGVKADYYATVESGLHKILEGRGYFGCQVLILEKAGETPRIGVDFDIEYPQEFLDKIPTPYADIGVLVQELYGATEKDPYPHLTGGKITRKELIENAFYRIAIQG